MNISPEQFLEYTPQELSGVLFYYNKTSDALFKSDWEKIRIQTYFLISIQLDKKNKMSYEKFKNELWPFFWEKNKQKSGGKILSPEEWNKIINKPVITSSEISAKDNLSI